MTDNPEPKKAGRPPMTEEAKAKVQAGMAEARAIRAYLEVVNREGFKTRHTQRAEAIQKGILESPDPVTRLKLRPQLRAALEFEMNEADLVKNFLEHVVAFSEKWGITYADWREEGVPASVLKDAGISRAS